MFCKLNGIRIRVYAVISMLSFLTTACSSVTPTNPSFEPEAEDPSTMKINYKPYDKPDYQFKSSRKFESIQSGIGVVGKAVLLDPVFRPVSTVKALYGLTIKSTGGFLERALIESFRMPGLESKTIPALSYATPMNLDSWERELDSMTSKKPTTGRIKFLVDGNEYFSRLIQAINEAEEAVNIRTYIYDNDDVALRMSNLLREKSAEIEVKILVDGLADLFATLLDSPSMPESTELPASMSRYLTYASGVEFRKQSNPWLTGDHAKITIIDEDLAFLGGMNIGREYRYDWHDLMMELDGPIVKELQFKFDQSWAKAGLFGDFAWLLTALKGYQADTSDEGYPIRILTTSNHYSELYRVQIAAIRRAKNRIYIENTYFSDDKILFELAMARRRGVDVRVILSSVGDNGILNLSNQKAINVMLKHGIRVFSFPGMTHVKAAVYDGWACLGSANFDKLSLQINQEINIGTAHPETVETLVERIFNPDFAISTELREPTPLGTRHHFAEVLADEFL